MGLSVPGRRPRDESCQRGYPSPNGRADRALDKGHMVPHQVGGDLGQNIFPQNRELNRIAAGQSRAGGTGRWSARSPRRLGHCFCRLVYTDETDFPAWVQLGVLRADALYVDRLRNRFD